MSSSIKEELKNSNSKDDDDNIKFIVNNDEDVVLVNLDDLKSTEQIGSGTIIDGESIGTTQFRLMVRNIPKYTSVKILKNLMQENGFGDIKTKERQIEALNTLNGLKFKNKKLLARIDDITEQDRQAKFERRNKQKQKNLLDQDGIQQRSPEELLADQVTPWHKIPYEIQLENKQNDIRKFIINLRQKISNIEKDYYNDNLPEWLSVESELSNFCDFLPILRSPITEGYRNKCEFTIGLNLDKEKTVGFLLGAYKDGLVSVLEPNKTIHVSDVAKKLAKGMQDYVRNSQYDIYDRRTKQVQLHPQNLTEEQLGQEKIKLTNYFQAFSKNENFNLTCLLIQLFDGVSNGMSDKVPYELLYGTSYIHEEMMNCRFRVSPLAFFQTNTAAAEVLYNQCRTIGIALSKKLGNKIKGVIGIELSTEAIEDAKINSILNGIENAEYIVGPVENNLRTLNNFNNSRPGSLIAILDPPRAGVHKKNNNDYSTDEGVVKDELYERVVEHGDEEYDPKQDIVEQDIEEPEVEGQDVEEQEVEEQDVEEDEEMDLNPDKNLSPPTLRPTTYAVGQTEGYYSEDTNELGGGPELIAEANDRDDKDESRQLTSLVAASHRKDRPPEAKRESAIKASSLYQNLTGQPLEINEGGEVVTDTRISAG
ncbi:11876_t:CDS:10 [Entrophospora sp. SA101]|nr:7502_t:CDS:10 [Entrophospora sp. SA101]CAJ0752792.1 11876_t:CDS:10 [Entrophospora sp. SA101]